MLCFGEGEWEWWGWGGTARHNTPSMVTCTSFVLGFVAICFVWSSPSLFKKITHHLIISPKLAKNIPELFTLITFKINTEGEISRLGKYSYLLLLHFEYMPKLANDGSEFRSPAACFRNVQGENLWRCLAVTVAFSPVRPLLTPKGHEHRLSL